MRIYLGADHAGFETKNVIAEHPEIADRLAATLKTYVDNGRSTPGPTLKNDAAVVWEKE